jgi:hypothetical protein
MTSIYHQASQKKNHQSISENLRMITTPEQNTIHQPTSTLIIDQTKTESNHKGSNFVKDDGFTVVQNHRQVHKKTSLEQLKKNHNIQQHGLPTPQVSFRNSYIAYYDLRVPLNQSKGEESPWDEVMRAFKALMTEIWAADPSTKVFIYLSKTRNRDTSFLDSPKSFKELTRENFTDYFWNGYPIYSGGMRNAQVLMSHAKPFDEIRRNISHYLQRFNAGF